MRAYRLINGKFCLRLLLREELFSRPDQALKMDIVKGAAVRVLRTLF